MVELKNDCIDAVVICHSQSPDDEELITVEVNFNRSILAQVNTHRILSRNYQSSRAVPVEKMLEQVRNNPALPVSWGKNRRGMVAGGELDTPVEVYTTEIHGKCSKEEAWKHFAKESATHAEDLHKAGYHKQIVNRLLEPFMWTKGVITATKQGWESVFKLRCHSHAQPEFQALANIIKERIEQSTPVKKEWGEYHLPYVNDPVDIEEAIKLSCSCCAQVSYRVLDQSYEKARKVYDMLNLPIEGAEQEDPPHFSPTEHIAKVVPYGMSGNFNSYSFYQYRKALEAGLEENF